MSLVSETRAVNGTVAKVERVHEEPSGVIGNTPDERMLVRMADGTVSTVNGLLTRAGAEGWRFVCLPGEFVKCLAPAKDTGEALSFEIRNAALWRAIKRRGIDLPLKSAP